uniref:hypothetical protein n=1 Tax=Rhodococcus qingshengii TaxID=334542 RepID=UPI001C4DFF01|nr:hypothetical protein [Rhodococcus qingshengii]
MMAVVISSLYEGDPLPLMGPNTESRALFLLSILVPLERTTNMIAAARTTTTTTSKIILATILPTLHLF